MTTTTETSPASTGTITYHWIMTLRGPGPDGVLKTSTTDGTANLTPRFSRSAAFKAATEESRRLGGFPPDGPFSVLFFSLEQDEL